MKRKRERAHSEAFHCSNEGAQMTQVAQSSKLSGDVPIANGYAPDVDGPRCLPYLDTITAGEPYEIDLTLPSMKSVVRNVQTLWIDNTAGAGVLTVTMAGTLQVIKVGAGDAGYYPVLMIRDTPKVTLSRGDTGAFAIHFINVPLPTVAGINAALINTLIGWMYASGATLSNTAANASNVTLLSASATRRGFVIVNDSASATCYVKFGATASATSYTYALAPGQTLTIFGYTGRVDAIWSAAVGNARVTELTP